MPIDSYTQAPAAAEQFQVPSYEQKIAPNQEPQLTNGHNAVEHAAYVKRLTQEAHNVRSETIVEPREVAERMGSRGQQLSRVRLALVA